MSEGTTRGEAAAHILAREMGRRARAIQARIDDPSKSGDITRAIDGILCSFVGLLFSVTIGFALNVHWDWPHLALAATAFAALFSKVDILWVVLVGTAISAFAF